MALHEIDADLKTAEATLRHWEKKYPEVARNAAAAAFNKESAWADAVDEIKARPVPEGQKAPTIPMIEAEATKKCSDKIKAKMNADAELDIAKRLIGIAETTLTSIQTRAKLDLIEAGLAR